MGPLMKEAMLPAAALVWSAVLEIVSLLRSSSSTLTDFAFSDFVAAASLETASMAATEGMMIFGVSRVR